MRTILIGIALLAAGCGAQPHAGATIQVVAAENAYGDIARQIGGSHVDVTSVLTEPNADPHLFEPGTANGLAVARADVVIENGLGYDAFMPKLERAAPSKRRVVVDIARTLGASGNPHLWYDARALPRIARAIERGLVRADPRRAAAFRAGLARFERSLMPLRRAIASLPAVPFVQTEPVAGYLLAAAGLRDLGPEQFERAIEDGTEPSPQAVADMLATIRRHRARVLIYNKQAVSPITSRVRDAARAAGMPVVGVTETLPPGTTFQAWQLAQVETLRAALR